MSCNFIEHKIGPVIGFRIAARYDRGISRMSRSQPNNRKLLQEPLARNQTRTNLLRRARRARATHMTDLAGLSEIINDAVNLVHSQLESV